MSKFSAVESRNKIYSGFPNSGSFSAAVVVTWVSYRYNNVYLPLIRRNHIPRDCGIYCVLALYITKYHQIKLQTTNDHICLEPSESIYVLLVKSCLDCHGRDTC